MSDSTKGSYRIKTFGARLGDVRLHRLPKVVTDAQDALAGIDVLGFLVCAMVRERRMTGLMFCDPRGRFPEGLPSRTARISHRFQRNGYEIVVTQSGDVFVVAHWYHQNCELDRFDRIH
ncbi:hypothetical protein [Pseudomonas sp. DSP3-2-2]|uniref:hypothetical protein n=1 Tax=unclassified Pseudomonas TaxID=196821 RepID=UPI003CEDCF43